MKPLTNLILIRQVKYKYEMGDRCLIEIGAIAVWCCWFVEGRSLVWWKRGYFRRSLFDEIRGDRCFAAVGLLRGDRLCGESRND
ncbi:MAG: hypothetical protein WCP16_22330 [Pseudanabaena sp. ELA645]|jgi:hypothetical protein